MSDYLNRHKRRLAAKGKNEGEVKQGHLDYFVQANFHKSPTYRRATVKSIEGTNEIDIRVITIERMGDIRQILFRPNEGVSIGSYLEFDNDTWLVFDKFGLEENGKSRVMVERCTEKLRWKDKDNTYFEEDCVASATQLGSKANQGKNALEWNKFDVRLPIGQIFVFVQRNEFTKTVAISQRFILGSNSYEITGYDDVTSTDKDGNGYIQITMSIVPKRDQDDFENKIAFNVYDETETTVGNDPEETMGLRTTAEEKEDDRLW